MSIINTIVLLLFELFVRFKSLYNRMYWIGPVHSCVLLNRNRLKILCQNSVLWEEPECKI